MLWLECLVMVGAATLCGAGGAEFIRRRLLQVWNTIVLKRGVVLILVSGTGGSSAHSVTAVFFDVCSMLLLVSVNHL